MSVLGVRSGTEPDGLMAFAERNIEPSKEGMDIWGKINT